MATARGNGFRIEIGPEYDTQTAEQLKDAAYRAHPEYEREQRTWGELWNGGWGQVVHAWLAANGDDDSHTVGNAVVRLGYGANGGKTYEIPNREHYDIGRVKNQPLYRMVTVYVDQEGLAQQEQAQLDEQARAIKVAKEAELARLQAAGESGDIDKQIAAARIKAGLGVKAKELSVTNGGRTIFTASSPAESMSAPFHTGKSIIDPGMWESITGGASADSIGLPFPILAFQPDGSVRPAKEEYDSILAAAHSTPPGPFSLGSGYSAAAIANAQAALRSIGITG